MDYNLSAEQQEKLQKIYEKREKLKNEYQKQSNELYEESLEITKEIRHDKMKNKPVTDTQKVLFSVVGILGCSLGVICDIVKEVPGIIKSRKDQGIKLLNHIKESDNLYDMILGDKDNEVKC